MQIEITIKNYRCFPDSKPAKILLRKGFTSLIGVNNSGKSTLLKFFYEFRGIFKLLSQPSDNIILALQDNPQYFEIDSSISDFNEIFCNLNNRDIVIEIRDLESTQNDPLIPNRIDIIVSRVHKNIPMRKFIIKIYLIDGLLSAGTENFDFQDILLRVNQIPKADLSRFFTIFHILSKTLYIGPFRNVLDVVADRNYFDISVGKNFIQTWRSWKTGNEIKKRETVFKLTESIKHIFDFEALEINPSENGSNLIIFINDKSYKLSELGSGITQFILVLANAAIQQSSYILIDEPELNLHPSLQLDFLTTLGSYASEGVLFATHNIGLARASSDRIYSFRKIIDGENEISILEDTPRLSEFLGELSFSGYKELGFDKVLLVEGTTDVKTIQQFLRLQKIDHKLLLLPLGGGSLINGKSEEELAEITRISPNIFALIDSERATQGAELGADRAAFVEICAKLKICCHVLDRRATENYLSDFAVKKIKGQNYRALHPYEKLNEILPSWSKTDNWKIAREMTIDELNATDLGKFLTNIKNIT